MRCGEARTGALSAEPPREGSRSARMRVPARRFASARRGERHSAPGGSSPPGPCGAGASHSPASGRSQPPRARGAGRAVHLRPPPGTCRSRVRPLPRPSPPFALQLFWVDRVEHSVSHPGSGDWECGATTAHRAALAHAALQSLVTLTKHIHTITYGITLDTNSCAVPTEADADCCGTAPSADAPPHHLGGERFK